MFVVHALLWSVVVVWLTAAGDVSDMQNNFVRVNWGVVFNKVGTILNGVTRYKHTFAVAIPDLEYTPLQPMPCETDMLRAAHCEGINTLTTATNDIFTNEFYQMRTTLNDVLSAIGAVDESGTGANQGRGGHGRRSKRASGNLSPDFCSHPDQEVRGGGGILVGLGKVASDIFGTPTYDDIKTVDKHICELADSAKLNSQEIKASNERLSSISAALNNRISALQGGLQNMNDRITDTQQELVSVASAVEGTLNNLTERLNFIETAQENMYLLQASLDRYERGAARHLDYTRRFIQGIHTLLEGYIPEQLVTVSDVVAVLKYVTDVVLPRHSQLDMVHANPGFYFQVQSTMYVRSSNYVFITLVVPLKTVGGILGVYRVDQTHLSTSQHQTSSTQIAGLPDFVAFTPDLRHYTEISVQHYTSCRGTNVRVCDTERALQSASRPTCAAALLLDRRDDVLELCDITFEPYTVPTKVIHLREKEYLVHAVSNDTWTMNCPYASKVEQISSCLTCVVTVPCGCSLDGGTFLIPMQLTGCSIEGGDPTISRVFPVNLPLVLHEFEPLEVGAITGDTLSHDLDNDKHRLSMSEVKFSIEADEWKGVVAKDGTYQVDFKRLLKNHKERGKTFLHRADYYLKKATDMSDLNLGHITDLENQFGGGAFLHTFLNPNSAAWSVSVFWIVGVSAIAMAIVNCIRRR